MWSLKLQLTYQLLPQEMNHLVQRIAFILTMALLIKVTGVIKNKSKSHMRSLLAVTDSRQGDRPGDPVIPVTSHAARLDFPASLPLPKGLV